MRYLFIALKINVFSAEIIDRKIFLQRLLPYFKKSLKKTWNELLFPDVSSCFSSDKVLKKARAPLFKQGKKQFNFLF